MESKPTKIFGISKRKKLTNKKNKMRRKSVSKKNIFTVFHTQTKTNNDQENFSISIKNSPLKGSQINLQSKEKNYMRYSLDSYIEEKLLYQRSLIKDYLQFQKEIDCEKRRCLFSWMMESSAFFSFKRDTYHLSIYLVDLFLSKTSEFPIDKFQLLGVTCLLIASKNEEVVVPSMEDFVESAGSAYTANEISVFETVVLKTLKWKIQYLTLSFVGSYIMKKWDEFSSDENIPKFFAGSPTKNLALLHFLVLDVLSLDYYSIFKDVKRVCGAVLYLIIGVELKYFNLKNIYLIQENSTIQQFNLYINQFFTKELMIELNELNGFVDYVSKFFSEELLQICKNYENKSLIIQDYSNVKVELSEKIENDGESVIH